MWMLLLICHWARFYINKMGLIRSGFFREVGVSYINNGLLVNVLI